MHRHRVGAEELFGDRVAHPEVAEDREAQAARALVVEARFFLEHPDQGLSPIHL